MQSSDPEIAAGTGPDFEPVADWNFGIRVFGRAYYLTLRLGAERRSPRRLAAEGQVRVPLVATAYVTTGSVLFCIFGIFCFLYLLKSMAGINLFAGASPFHPIYALFFE